VALFNDRAKLFGKLFPHDNVNYGTDLCWLRAHAYRQNVLPGAPVAIEARVMNHSIKSKHVRAELKLPTIGSLYPASAPRRFPRRPKGGFVSKRWRPERTAVAPLQDLLSLGREARMNVPDRVNGHWRWRCTNDIMSGSVFDRLGYRDYLGALE
jgi:hypothetical protein